MTSAPPSLPAATAGSAPGTPTRRCPSCGTAAASGRFCAECGASLEGGLCTACRSQLETGAKFCHRCGTAVGATGLLATGLASRGQLSTALPWAITALVLVGLLAFVAGRNLGAGLGRPGPSPDALGEVSGGPQDGASGGADAPATPGGAVASRAPDISSMSPRERADRLYDRVMRLSEEGKQDSVDFFAPMVTSAYQMLGRLDLDQHYDLGRVSEVTGAKSLAQAEADTILATSPTHLLGLVLAARIATDAHQSAAARSLYKRLVAAVPAEQAKHLPEYERHRRDIDGALADARKAGIAASSPQPAARN